MLLNIILSDWIWWSGLHHGPFVMDEPFSFQQRYLGLKKNPKQIKKPLLLSEWDNTRTDPEGHRTSCVKSIGEEIGQTSANSIKEELT